MKSNLDSQQIMDSVLKLLEERGFRPKGLSVSLFVDDDDFVALQRSMATKPGMSNSEMIILSGQSQDIHWNLYIVRNKHFETYLIIKKQPKIVGTTKSLFGLFQKHGVPLKGFQVNLVIGGAEFDRIFGEEAAGTILKNIVGQEEINGLHCTLQVTRAIEPKDLSIDGASTA